MMTNGQITGDVVILVFKLSRSEEELSKLEFFMKIKCGCNFTQA